MTGYPACLPPFIRCTLCNAIIPPEPIVLLACGSFNPVTNMHLRMMELARDGIERSWAAPITANSISEVRKNVHSELSENISIDADSSAKDIGLIYPNSRFPWRQAVLCGVFSPVSDKYPKSSLVPSSVRIELARLACLHHSDWLAVDTWEATQSEWMPTRLVADHLQSVLDRLWRSLNESDQLHNTSVTLPQQQPIVHTSNGQVSLHSDAEAAHFGIRDGLLSESLLLNCIRQSGQMAASSCPLCQKFLLALRGMQIASSSDSCESLNATSLTSHKTYQRLYPRPRVKLVFGADIIQSFGVPNLWAKEDIEHLLVEYGLVCITRPGYDVSKFIFESELLSKHENSIMLVKEWCENNLSSTLVRRSLKLGLSVLHLVPQAALERIYDLHLYGAQKRQRYFPQAKSCSYENHHCPTFATDCSD